MTPGSDPKGSIMDRETTSDDLNEASTASFLPKCVLNVKQNR